jgi:hypothetical protein
MLIKDAKRGLRVDDPASSGDEDFPEVPSKPSVGTPHTATTPMAPESYLIQQLRIKHIDLARQHNVLLEDLLPVMDGATLELRKACTEGLEVVREVVGWINERRLGSPLTVFRRFGKGRANDEKGRELDRRFGDALENLKAQLKAFTAPAGVTDKASTIGRLELIKPFEEIIRPIEGLSVEELRARANKSSSAVDGGATGNRAGDGGLPIGGLLVEFVFASGVVGLAEAVLAFMESVEKANSGSGSDASAGGSGENDIKNQNGGMNLIRKHPRLWAPTKLRNLWSVIRSRDTPSAAGTGTSRGVGGALSGQDEVAREEEKIDKEKQEWGRDPDSRPPTNAFQKVMNALSGLFRALKTPEGLVGTFFVMRF